MKRFNLITLFLFLLHTHTTHAKLMDITTFTLSNGLEVAVIENHKAPVILQKLYYKAGSINDPKGKGGIAHLLEHMMFRGTKKVPDKVFNQLTEEHGAENNAYTTYNETAYYEFTDISKLELMMALEADRMRGLNIDKQAFITERDIVLQERLQRFETNPIPLFYETIQKILWQDHPIANPVSGSIAEIKSLTVQDAKNFYNRYYRPNNAILVLSGDIDIKTAKTLTQKYYEKIPSSEHKDIIYLSTPKPIKTQMNIQLPGVEQPRYVEYTRLQANEFSKTDITALDILTEYLTGDDSSYLYNKLVYKDKSLLSIGANVSYEEKLGGAFSIYAIPVSPAQTIQSIQTLIDTNIQQALTNLTQEKLDKIKNQTLSNAVYLQENPETSASFVGSMLISGYTTDEIRNYDKIILSITLEDIHNAWSKVISSPAKVSGYLQGDTPNE